MWPLDGVAVYTLLNNMQPVGAKLIGNAIWVSDICPIVKVFFHDIVTIIQEKKKVSPISWQVSSFE